MHYGRSKVDEESRERSVREQSELVGALALEMAHSHGLASLFVRRRLCSSNHCCEATRRIANNQFSHAYVRQNYWLFVAS